MSQQAQSLTAETEAVRELYAALNRNDISAAVQVFDPLIEWIDPVEHLEDGTYRGLAAVEAQFRKARATWAEGSCEPQRCIAAGDKIVVFVQVRVRLINETEWREGRLADVYTFRNGKVIQARSFADGRQALEWAGVEGVDAE